MTGKNYKISAIDLVVIGASDFVQALILIASTVLIIAVAICGSDGGFAGFV